MSTRSKARKAALDILYESDIRNQSAIKLLVDRENSLDYLIREFTKHLVAGVSENLARIDEIILMRAKGWAIDRMPVVDRNILRLATYELLIDKETPHQVVIDEAVELAKSLSTDDSSDYINGVLGAIFEVKDDISL
ncbi:MAG: transcription antitermination factor NusB [Actinomycetales bacterium]|jgi:N utilization substance protein B